MVDGKVSEFAEKFDNVLPLERATGVFCMRWDVTIMVYWHDCRIYLEIS